MSSFVNRVIISGVITRKNKFTPASGIEAMFLHISHYHVEERVTRYYTVYIPARLCAFVDAVFSKGDYVFIEGSLRYYKRNINELEQVNEYFIRCEFIAGRDGRHSSFAYMVNKYSNKYIK